MVFFKETCDRLVTREGLIQNKSSWNAEEYLTKVNTDIYGNFISGISNLRKIAEPQEIFENPVDLDTGSAGGLYEAILDLVRKNICAGGSEFDDFSGWLRKYTRPLEKNWVERYKEYIRICKADCVALCGNFQIGDNEFFQLFQKVRLYWLSVKDKEYNICLWRGKFVAAVHIAFQWCCSLETVLEKKSDRERKCVKSEEHMWWERELSKFRLQNAGNRLWQYLSEYFGAIGRLLQAMVVKKTDFRLNPIHYMLPRGYDEWDINNRVGSEIVSRLIELAWGFEDCRYYGVAIALPQIIGMKDEIAKIRDDTVRKYAKDAVNMLASNIGFICHYINCWDTYISNYIIDNKLYVKIL